MKIAIIKYNAGNVCSVIFALERLGINPILTDDINELQTADKVIFPGVGEAGSTMKYLKMQGLHKVIPDLKQPVLGICIGMQLMCAHSEEGNTDCLNIFNQKVLKFKATATDAKNHPAYKIPHTGWNTVYGLKSPVFKDVMENEYMYFVHSYYVEIGEDTAASTSYINPFSSALQKNNFYAVQFHTEKSGTAGSKVLENFLLKTK